MSDINIDVHVGEGLTLPLPSDTVEEAARWVLESEGIPAAELSFAFLSDDEIAALNREYLHHEGPTDVISFPLHQAGHVPLGDVYVGLEQALRQAEEHSVPSTDEVLRLAIHGTLHILGYDHPVGEDRERSRMYLRQEELLRAFLVR